LIPTQPMQIISADHVVGLPVTEQGNSSLLVMIDHATRFVIAVPSYSLSATVFVDQFSSHVVDRFGVPQALVSDNGPAFAARVTQRYLHRLGIDHLPTPTYTPQSNGLVERANATVVDA